MCICVSRHRLIKLVGQQAAASILNSAAVCLSGMKLAIRRDDAGTHQRLTSSILIAQQVLRVIRTIQVMCRRVDPPLAPHASMNQRRTARIQSQ